MEADRGGGARFIDRDLGRTFVHEGIHTTPAESALKGAHEVYNSAKLWNYVHREPYNDASDALYGD